MQRDTRRNRDSDSDRHPRAAHGDANGHADSQPIAHGDADGHAHIQPIAHGDADGHYHRATTHRDADRNAQPVTYREANGDGRRLSYTDGDPPGKRAARLPAVGAAAMMRRSGSRTAQRRSACSGRFPGAYLFSPGIVYHFGKCRFPNTGGSSMKVQFRWRKSFWLLAALLLAAVAVAPAVPASADSDRMAPDVQFTGRIVTVGAAGAAWTVGPQTVATNARTMIMLIGGTAAAPGQWADVDAQRQTDGSLLATRIQVRPEAVQLRGIVTAKPTAADGVGDWIIAGVTVKATADTKIGTRGGAIDVGSWAEAVMTEDGGVLTAVRLLKLDDQDEVEVTGEIQSFAADKWVLSSIALKLDANTMVMGTPAVGLIAHAAAKLQDDGSLLAQRLVVKWNERQQPTQTRFEGVIEKLPTAGLRGEWVISGKTVIVPAMARINQEKGLAVVGAKVSVWAIAKDGKLTAIQITVLESPQAGGRPVIFGGRITALPATGVIGIWTVDNKKVEVTAQTVILPKDATPKVGNAVTVAGVRRADGSVLASQILIRPMGPRPVTPETSLSDSADLADPFTGLQAGME